MQSVRLHQLFKKRTFWEGAIAPEIQQISTDDSRVKVYVIPTNEELVIARDTAQLVKNL